jgi:thioredoxin 1
MKRTEADRHAILQSSVRLRNVFIAALGVALCTLSILLAGCGGGAADLAAGDTTATSAQRTSLPDSTHPMAGSGRPQLVDLGSEGCVPCDMMAGELEALKQQYKGSLDVVFVDVNKTEEGAALARELGIRVIPTQIFLDPHGKELARHEGYMSKEDMVKAFNENGYPLRRSFGSLDEEIESGDAGV